MSRARPSLLHNGGRRAFLRGGASAGAVLALPRGPCGPVAGLILALLMAVNDGPARLVFREIVGRDEVWLDGVKLAEKTTPEPGPLTLPLAKGARQRTLTVLVESLPGKVSGLVGPVLVEPGVP